MRNYISEKVGHNLGLKVLSYSLKFNWLVPISIILYTRSYGKIKAHYFFWKRSIAKSDFLDIFIDFVAARTIYFDPFSLLHIEKF